MNTYTHKELVELMRKQFTTSPKKAIAALLRIYENQRVDEKSYRSVYYKNGIGFKPQDVKVLSSMAEQAIRNKKMGKENLLTGFTNSTRLFIPRSGIKRQYGSFTIFTY